MFDKLPRCAVILRPALLGNYSPQAAYTLRDNTNFKRFDVSLMATSHLFPVPMCFDAQNL